MQQKLYEWRAGKYGRPALYSNPQELVVEHRRELQSIALKVFETDWPRMRRLLIDWMVEAKPNDEVELWFGASIFVRDARPGRKSKIEALLN